VLCWREEEVGDIERVGDYNMTDKTKEEKQWATNVEASHLELAGDLLKQVARHIKDGHFYYGWDDGKGWYFDTSDVHKDIFMVYDTMRNLMIDCFKGEEKDDSDDGKFVVNEQMFDYILSKEAQARLAKKKEEEKK
jgi:hypothetical protein